MPLTALFVCVTVLALAGPALWLLRPHRAHWFAWLAALPPAAVFGWLILQIAYIAGTDGIGRSLVETVPWVPSLGLTLSLRLDGLSLFFGLIVTGIGACIAFYTNYYFEHDEQQGYFYLLLFSFMACMLGLVLANNLLLLFVFWEGTSITSYLLIAFKRSYKGAVEGARRGIDRYHGRRAGNVGRHAAARPGGRHLPDRRDPGQAGVGKFIALPLGAWD